MTSGYALLPAARVKAVGLKPADNAAAADIVARELPKAIATCEAALSAWPGSLLRFLLRAHSESPKV